MIERSLLTKSEAAQLLRISPRTLDTARMKRGLPFITLPGCRKILFDEQQLRDWVNAHCVNSISPKTEV